MTCFVRIELLLLPMAVTAFAADLGRPVTFSKDVAPILERSCQNCHRPESIAPMSLLTYKEARPWARSIKEKVARRDPSGEFLFRALHEAGFANQPTSLYRNDGLKLRNCYATTLVR